MELRYQTLYVKAPRAVAEKYFYEPWSSLVALAERKEDGLEIAHGRPRFWSQNLVDAEDDVCFLCEGQHEWRGRTVLHQQRQLGLSQTQS